eukprot:scpid55842/ scgid3118/ 
MISTERALKMNQPVCGMKSAALINEAYNYLNNNSKQQLCEGQINFLASENSLGERRGTFGDSCNGHAERRGSLGDSCRERGGSLGESCKVQVEPFGSLRESCMGHAERTGSFGEPCKGDVVEEANAPCSLNDSLTLGCDGILPNFLSAGGSRCT